VESIIARPVPASAVDNRPCASLRAVCSQLEPHGLSRSDCLRDTNASRRRCATSLVSERAMSPNNH